MHPIRDQFDHNFIMVSRRSNDAGRAVRQGGHRIIQVGNLPRATAEGFAGCIVIRLRMCDRQTDLARQGFDGLHCSRQFGRQVAQFEQTVRLLLQAPEHLRIRCVQVSSILCSFFGRRDERTLHIDADERGSALLRAVRCSRLRDPGKLFFRISHGRRADGGNAVLRLIVRDRRDCLLRAVTEVIAHTAVKVQIHQAGHSVQPAHILRACRRLHRNDPVALDTQPARAECAIGLVYFQIFVFHAFPFFTLTAGRCICSAPPHPQQPKHRCAAEGW